MNEARYTSNYPQTVPLVYGKDVDTGVNTEENSVDRVKDVDLWFFENGGNPFREISFDAVYTFSLACCYKPITVIESCATMLKEDSNRLTYRVVCSGVTRNRLLAIEFDGEPMYIDCTAPVNLYLYLLLCMDQLMAADYELRRYRHYIAQNGDVILPMRNREWKDLKMRRGVEEVNAAFERITASTELTVEPDKILRERWWL